MLSCSQAPQMFCGRKKKTLPDFPLTCGGVGYDCPFNN